MQHTLETIYKNNVKDLEQYLSRKKNENNISSSNEGRNLDSYSNPTFKFENNPQQVVSRFVLPESIAKIIDYFNYKRSDTDDN